MPSEPTIAQRPQGSPLAPRVEGPEGALSPPQEALDARSTSTALPERFKYRLRFGKAGDLRLVSHHDLMHCCERLFRRAATPVAFTQGFHPTPKMVFALSLPLGVTGTNEVLELELSRDLDPDDLLQSLRRTAPPGLIFHNARRIPWRTTGQPRRSFYRIALPDQAPGDLPARCQDLLARTELWMERAKPYRRRVNIRPFIESIQLKDHSPLAADLGPTRTETPARPTLEFILWVTPFGTAKPDELLRLLRLDHLPEEGLILERSDLELSDEAGPDAPAVPIVDPKAIIAPIDDLPEKKNAAPIGPAEDESPRPQSLIDGPLSFDS